MSTSMDNLRNDVHKPAEQLEREADSARSAVEGTLAELQQRLSPGEMVDRAMDMVKRHGGEFGDNLLTQVRNNPIPTIIAGVGVAWLMAASKRRPPHGNWQGRYGDGRYEGDEDIDATESWASAATSAHHNDDGRCRRDARDSPLRHRFDARRRRVRCRTPCAVLRPRRPSPQRPQRIVLLMRRAKRPTASLTRLVPASAGLRTATRTCAASNRLCSARSRSRQGPRWARCFVRHRRRTACSARRATRRRRD